MTLLSDFWSKIEYEKGSDARRALHREMRNTAPPTPVSIAYNLGEGLIHAGVLHRQYGPIIWFKLHTSRGRVPVLAYADQGRWRVDTIEGSACGCGKTRKQARNLARLLDARPG